MITGNKVSLRSVEEKDLSLLRQWVNDRESMHLTGHYVPVSEQQQLEWYKTMQRDPGIYIFVIDCDEQPIGTCGLYGIHHFTRKAELRIRIGEKNIRSKGLGTEATRLLLDFAFADLNLHRVFLYVFEDNLPAIRVYEKCGFKREGLLRDDAFNRGQYRNCLVMGVLDSEWRERPPA